MHSLIILLLLVASTLPINSQSIKCDTDYENCMDLSTNQKLNCIDDFKACKNIDFVFPINFVIMTDNGSAKSLTTYSDMENIVTTLNRYFAAEDCRSISNKKKLVTFTMGSYLPYSKAKLRGSVLFRQINTGVDYLGDRINDLFDNEEDELIRDPNAINVYIYDSGLDGDSGPDKTGHGRFNGGYPYVMLDYARINTRDQAAEEHEMGHAFGLTHICNSMIDDNRQSSNIMTSAGKFQGSGGLSSNGSRQIECNHLGGKRDLGFTPEQAKIILQNAVKIHSKLKL